MSCETKSSDYFLLGEQAFEKEAQFGKLFIHLENLRNFGHKINTIFFMYAQTQDWCVFQWSNRRLYHVGLEYGNH